jgi:branched-chain amino acid transport system substrate-binding protein
MLKLPRRALLAACAGLAVNGGQALAEGGQTKPPAATPIIAGVLLPFSGDHALTGDECYRGILLAVDEVNAAGGIAGAPVTLVTGDAYSEDITQATAQTLITRGHAGLILGSGASALSYPGSAAAELAQIPYIELSAPADGIMTRGFKFLLRTGPSATMIATAAMAALDKHYAGKKIGLLFNTGATGGSIAAAALSGWQNAKTTPLLVIGYPPDAADLSGPVGRLKRAGAEVVLHAGDAADVLVLFAALQDVGWQPGIVGAGDGYLLRENAYALGTAFESALVVGAPFYPPPAATIETAYLARFGMPPRSPDSLTAFVGAKLVFDRLGAVRGDVSKLLGALRGADIPAGTLANGFGVAFDKNGQNTMSFVGLQQWKDFALTAVG